MPRSLTGKYGAELDTLRDQLIEAIRLRRLSALEAGLEVFEQLAEAILQRVDMIDEAMGDRRKEVSWWQTSGASRPADRLAPLSHALWPVIEQAVLSGDSQLIRQTLSTVHVLARTAYSRGDLASFTDVVVLYPRVARRLQAVALVPGAGTMGTPELTEELLGIVQTVHLRSRTGVGRANPYPYLAAALKQAWDMARLLIDESNPSQLEQWARAYEQALTLPLHGDDEASDALAVLTQAGAMALRGWILLSWQEDWRPLDQEAAVALYSALTEVGEPQYLWEAIVRDSGDHLGERLGFSWWESSARPSGGAYVMRFETYRDDAAAIALVRQAEARGSMPRVVDLDDMELPRLKQHGRAARRLQAALSRLDKYEALGVDTSGNRERVAARLGTVVEALELREVAQLIERPLESNRVAAFRDAVLSEIAQSKSFAVMLPGCPAELTNSELPSLFGVHSLAPKEFFVATDVHADPSSLGETMARSVIRGEDRLALERIIGACGSELLRERNISEAVSRIMPRFEERRDLHVMIFGVVDWWIQLRQAVDQDMGLGFNEPFQVDGVTYSQHRSGDFRGALIADLPRLACYSRAVAAADEARADDVAHLSVDVVSPAEAEEMALAKTPNLAEEELSMEKRQLQQHVRVRVLVRPLLKVLDPAAGRVVLPTPERRKYAED